MPPDSIPDGYRCIACGYEAGGLPGYVCPECAEPVTDEALVAWRARAELGRMLRPLLMKNLAGSAVIGAVYSIGAGIFAQEIDAAAAAAVGLALVMCGSLAAGMAAPLAAPLAARSAVAALWLRHLWILHLPWLVVGPGAIVFGALAMVRRLIPGAEAVSLVFGLLLLPIWLILSCLCLAVWTQRRQVDLNALHLRSMPVHILMMLGAIATLGAAILLGAAGGSLAVLGPLSGNVFPGEEF